MTTKSDLQAASAKSLAAAARLKACMEVFKRGNRTQAEVAEGEAAAKEVEAAKRAMAKALKATQKGGKSVA